MNTLTFRPSLGELDRFISKIDSYPVSVRQLQSLARKLRAPRSVIEFYKAFSQDQVFADRSDLTDRSQLDAAIRHEEAELPEEQLSVAQED